MEFVELAGGWFDMGSDDGQDDERPVHRVWVDPFAIAVHPVTNAESHPVVAVSWHDAMSYCESVGGVRLPTETEWEFAARGGIEGKRYPWGDDLPDDAMRRLAGPDRVDARSANGYGLFGFCENVHEWCADWYAADYYAVAPDRNPRGPATGTRRVSRGGSWRHRVKVTRCAARSSLPPDFRYADYGFRVVRC
ncbi:MAG TPA: formylglycine-generating enzyme family protein [Thermoanaerobaculia bacterium]|nr:formylglycine-generating enzyme family protein [Thermoanaerobaculia bacterium]